MNKGYWLVSSDISHHDRFMEYAAQTPPILAMFGGRFIVRAGQSTLVEGNSRARNAVIEFPTYQAALDCWESPEYQAVKQLREGAAELDVVIIEGVAG